MTFKEILRERLLLQSDISDATGLSRAAVNRAVQGKPIQRATFLLICRELNIDPNIVTGVNIHSGVAAQAAKKAKLI